MNNQFNTGDIIQHKVSDNNNPYYYVVLNTFKKYEYEYYNLFCFVLEKEVTLRMDNQNQYKVVSSVS